MHRYTPATFSITITNAPTGFHNPGGLLPMTHPISFVSWMKPLDALATALATRYQQLGKIEDLDMSIYLYRKALRLTPIHHSYRSVALHNVATTLGFRHQRLGKIEDLEQSISLYHQALDLLPVGDPDRSLSLLTLAGALTARHLQLGRIDDLEQSISLNRQIIDLLPIGDPSRSVSSNNLATALLVRFNKFGDINDLAQSISLYREALGLCPPGHPNRHACLNNLASCLDTRYKHLGNIEDLEQAIPLHREALSLLPAGNPVRFKVLCNLGTALSTRYGRLGNIKDLQTSIAIHREALNLFPVGHPDRSIAINNLGSGFMSRYKRLGAIRDLEQSLSFYLQSLGLCPVGHPGRPLSFENLAVGLSNRYDHLGNIEDLKHAISLHRIVLNLRPVGHADRWTSLANLAICLNDQYKQFGNIKDLEQIIYLQRKALKLCPVGHHNRSASLSGLANALRMRHEQLGSLEDLEQAVYLLREALDLHPVGHPNHPTSLSDLGNCLSNRYQQLGNIEDLEQTISLRREALSHFPVGHRDHASSLHNLATSLSNRYKQFGDINDLEQCISLNYESLSLLPVGHPDRSMSLNNLGATLIARHTKLGNIEDLDKSISLHREALSYHPVGHRDRSMSLAHLGNALTIRFRHCANIDNLEEAIPLHREALDHLPVGHPGRSSYINTLSMSLLLRYSHFDTIEDLKEVFTRCEESVHDWGSYLKHRLATAIVWASIARAIQHPCTLNAYDIALQLLHRSLISRSNVKEQQTFLATADIPKSLASDAASAAIQAGKMKLAVQFLELGRAILWSRIDTYKSPLEQLRQAPGGAKLADRLETINGELERLVLLSDRTETMGEKSSLALSLDARIRRHRILSDERESLVAQIQEIEGFSYFLETPPFDILQSAAAEGPVIFINISKYRSDAIIVTRDNPPNLVPLPTLEPAELHEQADRLKKNRLDSRSVIISVLGYMWDNIVEPVVTRLRELGVKKKNRIWWCPTGELCALPLHAARPRDSKKGLPELYTSSYTSTLSSLIKARSNIATLPNVPKLLVVGQPDKTLKNVGDEVGIVKQFGDIVDEVLIGAEATHESVLHGLQQHSWVHFACHGHLGNNDQPFEASFELHDDHRLSLLDLIRARLPNAECAFLAACHSAAGDSRTPDETIHLSAALQFCGFRSVVGTLWEMDDEDGPMMAKEFYEYMFRNPEKIDFRDSAHALSTAIRAMRKAKLPEDRWVIFVHIGA